MDNVQSISINQPKDSANVFTLKEYRSFLNWLNLDEDTITWEGRYLEDFYAFWNLFFHSDATIKHYALKFKNLRKLIEVGPLHSWLKWVELKFYAYCFIHKKFTLEELATEVDEPLQSLSTELRNFFVDFNPLEQDYFDDVFEAANRLSSNKTLTFKELKEALPGLKTLDILSTNEMMGSLEVTLYPEWKKILMTLDEAINHNKSIERSSRFSSEGVVKFFKDLVILLVIAVIATFLVKEGNNFYESYLINKIKIFEPEFLWLDKSLSFKDESKTEQERKEIINELSELDTLIQKRSEQVVKREERFEVESDVVLSSIENLPNRLDSAASETSRFQESRTGVGFNFRSYRYGKNQVYRMMLKSVRPDITRARLLALLKKYGIEQADHVVPGTQVPGGLYYNLFVPREFLQEFIFQVSEEDEATLFETKTRGINPRGKNRVFIFVKII